MLADTWGAAREVAAMWKRICCATDLSDASRPAFEEAVRIARESRAELFLVHVLAARPSPTIDPLLAPPPRAPSRADPDQGRLKAWTEEGERLASGAVVTCVELSGAPAEEIVRLTQEFGFDLLVMGTHGRSGVRHLALGSVAEAVIRAAPCPVLVIRSARDLNAPRPG
jgi:nucleotide-binding universal stress UspA family protein